jgi:hypothetical protein
MPATAASSAFYRVTTWSRPNGKVEQTTHLVTLRQAWEMAFIAQQRPAERFIRLSFEAVVKLAKAGAFPLDWAEARAQAVDEYLAEVAEPGVHGLGSSDQNHITVSFLQSQPVWEPASAASLAPDPYAVA